MVLVFHTFTSFLSIVLLSFSIYAVFLKISDMYTMYLDHTYLSLSVFQVPSNPSSPLKLPDFIYWVIYSLNLVQPLYAYWGPPLKQEDLEVVKDPQKSQPPSHRSHEGLIVLYSPVTVLEGLLKSLTAVFTSLAVFYPPASASQNLRFSH